MPDAARGYAFGALAHRNFRFFFFGQAISLTGTWMQTVAQGWLVLLLTDSPFYVGLVAALGSLGVLLFSLYAGVIADRRDKRRTVVVTQTLSMLQAFALATLVWTGAATVAWVMILAAFLGVVNAFDIPTRQSFVPDMVGKVDLTSAIALNSSVFNASRVVGPALAGVVIGAAGVGWCFFLNGLSYLAVIGGLLAMRLPPRSPAPPPGSWWTGFREIVTYVRRDARVSTLIVLTALLSVFGFPVFALMPVFARDVLRVGAEGYGALMSAVGVGAVAGALGVAVMSRRRPSGPIQLVGGATFGVLIALFAASRSFALAVVLLGFAGCAMIVNNALTNTMLQTLVPDHMRGRVMGFYSFVFIGMAPIGAFQAGVFAERLGTPVALATGGLLCTLSVALAAWRVPELRRAT